MQRLNRLLFVLAICAGATAAHGQTESDAPATQRWSRNGAALTWDGNSSVRGARLREMDVLEFLGPYLK